MELEYLLSQHHMTGLKLDRMYSGSMTLLTRTKATPAVIAVWLLSKQAFYYTACTIIRQVVILRIHLIMKLRQCSRSFQNRIHSQLFVQQRTPRRRLCSDEWIVFLHLKTPIKEAPTSSLTVPDTSWPPRVALISVQKTRDKSAFTYFLGPFLTF